MVTEGNAAVVSPVEPSRLPEMLAQVRTPLEVLCSLAEEGAACGFDLWAMAVTRRDLPEVYLCSAVPLSAACAVSQLAHFVESAADLACEGDLLMPDWSAAPQRVVCLQPQLPPLTQELAQYRDTHLSTGEQTGVIVRAATLAGSKGTRLEPDWSRLPIMVQYASPHLRSMNLVEADTTRGMIDVESGMYSWPYFIDAIEREVDRARRYECELSLAILELKPLGLLGEIAPNLHRRVGEHIMASVRRSDLVGRVGKRTYAVFFHGTGPRPALIAAGRIADALKADEALNGFLSCSLGVSGWEHNGPLEVSTLMGEAGAAAAEAALISPGSAFVYI
jgi:GGDEF domain-containing protein